MGPVISIQATVTRAGSNGGAYTGSSGGAPLRLYINNIAQADFPSCDSSVCTYDCPSAIAAGPNPCPTFTDQTVNFVPKGYDFQGTNAVRLDDFSNTETAYSYFHMVVTYNPC